MSFTKISQSVSQVTAKWKVYFIFGLSLLSACLFLFGILSGEESFEKDLNKISDSTLLTIIGIIGFILFFSMTQILILYKSIDELKGEVEALKKNEETDTI